MIKNRILLILCMAMMAQPLLSLETAKSAPNSQSTSSSWARSPYLWGGIAALAAAGAWLYRQYKGFRGIESVEHKPEEGENSSPLLLACSRQ